MVYSSYPFMHFILDATQLLLISIIIVYLAKQKLSKVFVIRIYDEHCKNVLYVIKFGCGILILKMKKSGGAHILVKLEDYWYIRFFLYLQHISAGYYVICIFLPEWL